MSSTLPQQFNCSSINFKQKYMLIKDIKQNDINHSVLQLRFMNNGIIIKYGKNKHMLKFRCWDVSNASTTLCLWYEQIKQFNQLCKQNKLIEISSFRFNSEYKSISIGDKTKIRAIKNFIIQHNDQLFIKQNNNAPLMINDIKQKAITNFFKFEK